LSFRKALSAIALASTVLIGATGCSFSHNVTSMLNYAPSDGVQADAGQLALRNAFFLTVNGKTALFASIVNSGVKDIDATIQYDDPISATKKDIHFPVFAHEKLDLGYNGNPPILIDLPAVAGANIGIYLLGAGQVSTRIDVPVLDSSNPLYAPYADLIGK
jgi:hypothetical protein